MAIAWLVARAMWYQAIALASIPVDVSIFSNIGSNMLVACLVTSAMGFHVTHFGQTRTSKVR